jgi:enamine deaminase RidA (YjgF/YER057c/UK114 family)
MILRHFESGARFPDAWQVGDLLLISGQVALDSAGKLVGAGDIAEQTRVSFENMGRVLERAGCRFADLVKLNTFLVFDGPEEQFAAYWQAMDAARRPFLPDPGPAATAVRVPGLAMAGLLIEIDGMAVCR